MRLIIALQSGEELLNLAVPSNWSARLLMRFCREFGKRNPYFIFKIEYRDDTLLPF